VKRIALLSILVLAAVSPVSAQGKMGNPFTPNRGGSISGYVNVQDYGARGNGVTDDTPGILAAVNAALFLNNGNFVYFPPPPNITGAYCLLTPLVLPPANKWTVLYFDARVALFAPIIMNNFYILRGNSGTDPSSFSQNTETIFATFMTGQQAGIQIHGKWNIRLENFKLAWLSPGQDGILIDETSGSITLKDVAVEMTPDNTTGFPLHIKGGTLIDIEGGVYGTPPASTATSIEIETDPNTCALMGLFSIEKTVVQNSAVRINLPNGCGVFAQLDMEDVLYEDGGGPLLTTIGLGGSLSAGIFMKNDSVSDGTPNSTCLGNQGQAWAFQVINCLTGGTQAITQGDPILDLEIWSMGSQAIGQSTSYVYHGMNGIVSTMSSNPPTPGALPRAPKLPNMNYPVSPFKATRGMMAPPQASLETLPFSDAGPTP
jgi:Pectate lyase superfamily protein